MSLSCQNYFICEGQKRWIRIVLICRMNFFMKIISPTKHNKRQNTGSGNYGTHLLNAAHSTKNVYTLLNLLFHQQKEKMDKTKGQVTRSLCTSHCQNSFCNISYGTWLRWSNKVPVVITRLHELRLEKEQLHSCKVLGFKTWIEEE